jgi:hypothetical protein
MVGSNLTILDQIAKFFLLLSDAPSYWFTLNTSCDHAFHLSKRLLDLTMLTCFLEWFLSALCLREWGHKAAVGRRRPPWSSARSQSVVTRMTVKISIMKIYSRFKGTDLSRSMLANFFMPQRRDRGAMAAMGRRRPPWSGCNCLPSFRLAIRVSEVCQPKNQQKPNHCPTRYLHQYLAEWDV